MNDQSTPETLEGVTAEAVASYLDAHPDFFAGHERLLERMTIPHRAGGAVSLLERQVELLRGRNEELQRRLQQLAQAARSNEVLLERLQSLILKLIASRDLDSAIAVLEQGLREDFHADFVTLRLTGGWDRPEAVDPDAPASAAVKALLNRREPICGYLPPEQKALLFGSAAGEVASSILLPLCESAADDCLGLLAVGSVDPKRFHPEMGTVFVAHLGAVATRVLRSHLADL